MTDQAGSMQQEPWHLDRKVPLALIFTLILQAVTFGWWASAQESRLNRVEEIMLMQRDDPVRLARLEGFRDELTKRLERFEAKLDRLIEDRPGR